MKILVSAYAMSPSLGSEYAQGWNYCVQMSKYCKITVLVGSSDGSMGEFSTLERELSQKKYDFNVLLIRPDYICKAINTIQKFTKMNWLFVLSLRRWNTLAFREAKKLHQNAPFDVVHHLGPLGFKNPGMLYKLNIPSYLGPVGGFQFINLKLAFKSSLIYGFVALARNILNRLFIYDPYISNAINKYGRISYVTSSNRNNFEKYISRSGPIISDQGAYEYNENVYKAKLLLARETTKRIAWCGSLDSRKNVKLLLDVIRRSIDVHDCVSFDIIGGGPLQKYIRKWLDKNKLGPNKVRFHGRVERAKVLDIFYNSTALLFTSLSEANTATFFEAISAFMVPIALDLDGFHDNINEFIGILVDPCASYNSIVESYAEKIGLLLNEQTLLNKINNIKYGYYKFTWEFIVKRHFEEIHAI